MLRGWQLFHGYLRLLEHVHEGDVIAHVIRGLRLLNPATSLHHPVGRQHRGRLAATFSWRLSIMVCLLRRLLQLGRSD